jgi:hypothetical protein
MGCGCGIGGYSYKGRSFLTKEEKVQLLKEYNQELEREAQGVKEKIKELEATASSYCCYYFFYFQIH